jgi:hypothetical protein
MSARLVVQAGNATPAVLELCEGEVALLGRSRDSRVFIQDKHASRHHARVFHENGGWHIADEGTINGTRVDGRRVQSSALADGQVITIGAARLLFRVGPEQATVVGPSPGGLTGPLDLSKSTLFESDELIALLRFTSSSLENVTPEGLIGRALEMMVVHMGASVAGLLGLPGGPPRAAQVRPARATLCPRLSELLAQVVLRRGQRVWLEGEGGAGQRPEGAVDAVCVPLRCGAGPDAYLGAVHAYNADRPFTERQVRFCDLLCAALANALEALQVRRVLEAENERLRALAGEEELIGPGPALAAVREQIARLATSTAPVLIVGEKGVGKEVVALTLHQLSPRHAGPFVVARRGTLFETTLPDCLLRADSGTLLVEAACELPVGLQQKLLQAGEGGQGSGRLDVRLIASTARPAGLEAPLGLLASRIEVPPLRERPEDALALARHFLDRLGEEYGRRVELSNAARERLLGCSWPGNVRQLRAVLEAAVARATDRPTLEADDLALC